MSTRPRSRCFDQRQPPSAPVRARPTVAREGVGRQGWVPNSAIKPLEQLSFYCDCSFLSTPQSTRRQPGPWRTVCPSNSQPCAPEFMLCPSLFIEPNRVHPLLHRQAAKASHAIDSEHRFHCSGHERATLSKDHAACSRSPIRSFGPSGPPPTAYRLRSAASSWIGLLRGCSSNAASLMPISMTRCAQR
jgi:hypothetical protein